MWQVDGPPAQEWLLVWVNLPSMHSGTNAKTAEQHLHTVPGILYPNNVVIMIK
jgi:hypothetical protein